MAANNETEAQLIDVLEQQIQDFRTAFAKVVYASDYETQKSEYANNLPAKLKLLDNFLDGKEWSAGSRLTYVDFLLYEALDLHRVWQDDVLNDFSNLTSFMDRFEALPGVAKHYNSPNFQPTPIFGPQAKWANMQ